MKRLFPIWVLALSACLKVPDLKSPSLIYFNTDTLWLDTIFTGLSSATYYLKLYNPTKDRIVIPAILLSGSDKSPFRLNVNGKGGRAVRNVIIEPNDSIFIFVEATINPTVDNLPFVVYDKLIAIDQKGEELTSVVIAAYGQNAHYYRNIAICNMTWTADKPHVLLGSVFVDTNCVLTIKEGARVHLDQNSALFIAGTLVVDGSFEKPVVFQQSRLEDFFKDIPGQWQAIVILPVSRNNVVKNAIIKNGVAGLIVDSTGKDAPSVRLYQVHIDNMLGYGILAGNSYIYGENVVVSRVGDRLIAAYGSKLELFHATIAGYSGEYLRRNKPGVLLANYYGTTEEPTTLEFLCTNCIIYGDQSEELELDWKTGADSIIQINNAILKTENSLENFTISNIIKEDPQFTEPTQGNYTLLEGSPAIDAGTPTHVLIDFEGKARDAKPDLGSWEF